MNSSMYIDILIAKLEMLRDNLNNSISEIENINSKLSNVLSVNGNSCINADLYSIKSELISKRNFINDYAIPEARNIR